MGRVYDAMKRASAGENNGAGKEKSGATTAGRGKKGANKKKTPSIARCLLIALRPVRLMRSRYSSIRRGGRSALISGDSEGLGG